MITMDDNHVPAFLVASSYMEARKQARKYVKASLAAGHWLDDPVALKPVPISSLEGIYIKRIMARTFAPKGERIMFAGMLTEDEEVSMLWRWVADERGLEPRALVPLWRRMVLETMDQFWGVLCAVVGADFWEVHFEPPDLQRWCALWLSKVLPRLKEIQRLDSGRKLLKYRGDGEDMTSAHSSADWAHDWGFLPRIAAATLVTAYDPGEEAEHYRKAAHGFAAMSPDEFIEKARQTINPFLPPDGVWREPARLKPPPVFIPSADQSGDDVAEALADASADGAEKQAGVPAYFYWYFVPWEPDVAEALRKLKEREFRAGRYYPATVIEEYPIDAEAAGPGPGHESIEAAQEAAAEEGTHSILDIRDVSSKYEPGSASPMDPEWLKEVYGTVKPTRAMIERNMDAILAPLDAGECHYLTIFSRGKPREILFCGRSWD